MTVLHKSLWLVLIVIVLELIIAFLVIDFQRSPWQYVPVILCLIAVGTLYIIIAMKADRKSKETKGQILQIEAFSKETNEGVKTLVKKADKIYPDNKNEAKIMIGLEGLPNIIEGYNVGTITEHGVGEIDISFEKGFKDQFYEVRMRGNKGEIKYNNIEKEKTSLYVDFDEEGLEWIEIICWER